MALAFYAANILYPRCEIQSQGERKRIDIILFYLYLVQ